MDREQSRHSVDGIPSPPLPRAERSGSSGLRGWFVMPITTSEARRMSEAESTRTPTRGSALVLVEDQRSALAAVLILQEMGYSVDIAVQPEAALEWIRLARYQWI